MYDKHARQWSLRLLVLQLSWSFLMQTILQTCELDLQKKVFCTLNNSQIFSSAQHKQEPDFQKSSISTMLNSFVNLASSVGAL